MEKNDSEHYIDIEYIDGKCARYRVSPTALAFPSMTNDMGYVTFSDIEGRTHILNWAQVRRMSAVQ